MRWLCVVFFTVLAVILQSSAFAEDDPKGPQRLDPIVVTASRVPERPSGSLFGTTVLQSSRSVDIITQEDIKRSSARTVPELLKGRAGVAVKEYTGNGKTAQVDIRGFGETAPSNVLVLIDGRRANQNDISGTDWLQIDIDSVERIEIVRGSQSVLYGDNAVGGVVNIITKRGGGKPSEVGASYDIGSYHYNSYNAHALGGSKFLDYSLNVDNATTSGYRGNSDLENIDFTNTYTIKPTDYFHIRCDGGYHKDWFGMPGSVTDMQIERDGWRACDDPGNRGKTEDAYITGGFDFFGFGRNDGTAVTVDIIARNRRSATLSFFAPSWYENNSHIRTFGVTPKAAVEFQIAGVPNRIVFGADYYMYKNGILGTNWVNTLFGDGRQKDLINIEEQTFGIYASDSFEPMPGLTLEGGVRGEWSGFHFDQEYITANISDKRSFDYAFDCGVNYRYNEDSALYANLSRSFRLPAIDEWYQSTITVFGAISGGLNLDLEPQTGMSYEVGVRDNTIKWLKLNADYFIMDTRHELFYDPVNYVNMIYDRTMRHGLECEAHLLAGDDADIFARYTYENVFFVGGRYAGNTIPMVPQHMLTWGVSYTFMDCVDIDYKFNFVGPRYSVSDQRNVDRKLKHYVTNDIRIGYHKYGFEVYGALNNMFDYKYSDIGAWGAYYPANGRNYIIGVKQKF